MKNSDMPAMPNVEGLDMNDEPYQHTAYTGLTKREDFAKAALQGLCTRIIEGDVPSHVIASYAVTCADALLKALEES